MWRKQEGLGHELQISDLKEAESSSSLTRAHFGGHSSSGLKLVQAKSIINCELIHKKHQKGSEDTGRTQ